MKAAKQNKASAQVQNIIQVDHTPLPLLNFPVWQFHDCFSGLLRETILDFVFNTIQYLPFESNPIYS